MDVIEKNGLQEKSHVNGAYFKEGLQKLADRHQIVGISLDGRYAFFARSPVRPYLLSGFGLYQTTSTVTANYVCADFSCQSAPGGRATFREGAFDVGLHSGVGLAFPLRRSELSLEVRFLQLMEGQPHGYTFPVVFGLRF
jgi:hypothetical protein